MSPSSTSRNAENGRFKSTESMKPDGIKNEAETLLIEF